MRSYGVFMSLSDFTQHTTFRVHSCCLKWYDFLVLLNDLCSPACVCVCVCVYINFFTHSSIYGHLDCSHILPVVNNAALGVQISFWVSVFVTFGYIPRSGIAASYGSSIFNFWGSSILFSIEIIPTYIPTISMQGFSFLHIHASICYLLSFW